MKILINSLNYKPELTGIGKYSGEMAEWLAERGHEVRVIAAPPYYPEWKIRDGYSSWNYKKEYIAGVQVYRCPLWIPKNINGSNRIIHLASFALSSFVLLLTQIYWRPHVILNIAPALLSSPFTLLYSNFTKAKTWLHIQDFELDAAFNLGILKSPVLKSLFRLFESKILKGFARVSTISRNMCENLRRKKVCRSRIFLFPNWVDIKLIYPLHDTNPMRAELGIQEDAIVALYAGNMGQKQGIEILIDVAQLLKSYSNIKFVFCGGGSVLSHFKTMAAQLSNVIFIPLQPIEKLNYLLNLADIHLLPQKINAADLVMPSKITGILASGVPVIATTYPGSEIGRTVKNRGIVVPPDNAEVFSQALLWLANHPEVRAQLGKNGRIFAEKYLCKEKILLQFEKSLIALLDDQKEKYKKSRTITLKMSYPKENQYSIKHSA